MGTIKKLKSKLSAKGSVLVFTLIILFIILAAAIGISSVSVLERKGAHSTDVSVQSFQIANSGAERILKKIADNSSGTLNDLGTCAGGKLTGSISSGKNYEITFYTSDGLPITDCGITASNVDKIKSVGSYANTARAIEVAVAAVNLNDLCYCIQLYRAEIAQWGTEQCARIGNYTATAFDASDGTANNHQLGMRMRIINNPVSCP